MQAADRTSVSKEGAQKAHSSDATVQEQHKQAVVWLLLAAPAVAAAAATADLLSRGTTVPGNWSMQLWALQLVEAGVRVSYAQLLAAAHSMVAGAEVWVQAQPELGLQTDIPEWAAAICCEYEEVRGLWLWPLIAAMVLWNAIGLGLECTLRSNTGNVGGDIIAFRFKPVRSIVWLVPCCCIAVQYAACCQGAKNTMF
jgi:hypothetical protein